MTDPRLLERLREAFSQESEERLRSMSLKLVELEKASGHEETEPILAAVYRDAHSLKGAARAVQHSSAERVCQAMEEVLSALQEGRLSLEPRTFDLLHSSLRAIRRSLEDHGLDAATGEKPGTTDVVDRLLSLAGGGGGGEEAPGFPGRDRPADESDQAKLSQAIRVPVDTLDSLLRGSEELIGLKLTARQELAGLRRVAGLLGGKSLGRSGRDRTVPEAHRLAEALQELIQAKEASVLSLSQRVDRLLEEMKTAALLPFAVLFELFPLLVRDLASAKGLDVELVVEGSAVRADRRVLEAIKDPLVHLLRNAIDHGFSDRVPVKGRGKGSGRITVRATQLDANHVEVIVADDGRGMDASAITEAAVRGGAVSRSLAKELTPEGAFRLALQSGISTRESVTDVSGRGVGLAVVADVVERLGGRLDLESEPGLGTTFRMILPVTVATVHGLLVQVGGEILVIPTAEVRRVSSFHPEEVRVGNGVRTVTVGGRLLPFFSLADILGLPRGATGGNGGGGEADRLMIQAVVLGADEDRIALDVGEVRGEEEVLAKTLGPQLGRVKHFSGGTILAGGRLALLLNTRDLLETARASKARSGVSGLREEDAVEPPPRVLLAEDSFTSRTLLKNILESAGYEVKTAIDGAEALALLRVEHFDLLLSDVEMPRMGGLELTERIRADETLGTLPVVLVSSLDRPEDRERGVRAGADAYVGKSSFDQGNLLDVVRRYC